MKERRWFRKRRLGNCMALLVLLLTFSVGMTVNAFAEIILRDIEIEGYQEPEILGVPMKGTDLTVTEGCEVSVKWYETRTSGQVTGETRYADPMVNKRFLPGYYYYAEMAVKPKTGYKFATNANITMKYPWGEEDDRLI